MMKNCMNKSKTIFVIFIVILIYSKFVFANSINMNIHYGMENIVKIDETIPITIDLTNRDEEVFDGYINLNVYESNDAVYRYKENIKIEGKEKISKVLNISISDRSNTIIVDLFDLYNENVISERLNIDLTTIQKNIIIGILSNSENKLRYFDGVKLTDNDIKTKTFNLKIEQFLTNRQILDQIDCLVISDFDFSYETAEIAAFNTAILDFLKKGKSIIIGTGKNGENALPKIIQSKTKGPTYVIDEEINLNNVLTDENNFYTKQILKITKLDLSDSIKKYQDYIFDVYIEKGLVSVAIFDYCDLNQDFTTDDIFIKKILTEVIDSNTINTLIESNKNINRYNTIKKLVDVADLNNLPDTLFIFLIISIYISFITIILYAICININKKYQYEKFIFIISIIFTIFLYLILNKYRKEKTFLNFIDITELNSESTNEIAVLNFINIDNDNYSFAVNLNNTLYPLVKNLTTPVYREEITDNNNLKIINIETVDSEKIIDVKNAKEFDSNIFIYKNFSDLNSSYPIDLSLNYFDGRITGMVANNMDKDIKDASIIFYGKTLYVGTVKAGTVTILPRGSAFNSPIGNNTMQADLMCYYPNTNIVKYYLDSLNSDSQVAKLVGFIDENDTINLYSYDVSGIFGNTMLVKNFNVNFNDEGYTDIAINKNQISNMSGIYNSQNNSINGDMEVINKYTFSNMYNYKKIYYENLSDFDSGKNEYNVPFYGTISAYNVMTGNYDEINDKSISDINTYMNEKNELIIKYTPTGKDFLGRKISLPLFRAIGQKK